MSISNRSKFFVLLAVVLLMAGCASIKTFNVRPAGCEQSVIYDYLPYPEATIQIEESTLLKVAANNPVIKPYLVKFSQDMIVLLNNPSITYFDLGRLALDQTTWANGYVGMTVLVVSQVLAPFDKQVSIYGCDRQFLINHYNRQLLSLR